ncbi:MAG: SUF system NifU family Fe-S cluster assembly protein [Microbacteriaceae bacterium]|nr:SUF system NifU family Fe-S cluster assembly protein [Microbacteriaceae bacterium]
MSMLDSLYQDLILDHSKRPVGKGELANSTGSDYKTASHHELNPSCGDEITLDIAVDNAGRVQELKWRGQGCSISQASASMLAALVAEDKPDTTAAQHLINEFRTMLQSRDENTQPDEKLLGDAVALQGVAKFVMRIKCAMLAWVALEADLRQIETQQTA